MPHSGAEMAEQILRIGPDVPIIFMSGTSCVSEMPEHLKPFRIEKLSQMIQESLQAETALSPNHHLV
jgi:hypothetical protein